MPKKKQEEKEIKRKKLPKVEYKILKLSKLNPAKYNPRFMTEAELYELECSIEIGGMLEPLVVNKDMTVIGGHQRLKVLQSKFDIDETMCTVVNVDKRTEKKLNLALNKITGNWDEEKLIDLIYELKDDRLPGYSDEEKEQYITQKQLMLENRGEYNPDDDEDMKKIFERNEKVPISLKEPDAPHNQNQLAFYVETFEEYDKIRKVFKSSRKGELDKNKLMDLIKK
jgi:hypothetical protein